MGLVETKRFTKDLPTHLELEILKKVIQVMDYPIQIQTQ